MENNKQLNELKDRVEEIKKDEKGNLNSLNSWNHQIKAFEYILSKNLKLSDEEKEFFLEESETIKRIIGEVKKELDKIQGTLFVFQSMIKDLESQK